MKKITLKTFIETSNIDASLIRATVKNLNGWDCFNESAPDITNYGINGGFGGFIYYTDTVKFYKKNKKAILELAKEQSSDFGQGMFEMISSFNCMKNLELSEDEIAEALYTFDGECSDQIMNCMAWYAGEEVARAFCDMLEE